MNPNVVVFGISADSKESHSAFAQSLGLKFSLLADEAKDTCKRYDALNADGSLKRMTYIIGPDGTVRGVDGQVDAQIRGTGPQRQTTYGTDLALLLSNWKAKVGQRVPNFMLPDAMGNVVPAYRFGQHRATVFLVANSAAESKGAIATCDSLASLRSYSGVRFVAISPPSENFSATHVETCTDKWEEVQPHFDLSLRPAAFVVDGKGQVVYRGRMEDVINGRERNLVRDALDSLLAGKPVAVSERL